MDVSNGYTFEGGSLSYVTVPITFGKVEVIKDDVIQVDLDTWMLLGMNWLSVDTYICPQPKPMIIVYIVAFSPMFD